MGVRGVEQHLKLVSEPIRVAVGSALEELQPRQRAAMTYAGDNELCAVCVQSQRYMRILVFPQQIQQRSAPLWLN